MQYEMNIQGTAAEVFKENVRIELKKRDITYEELAEAIDYSVSALRKFFTYGKWNRFLAATISDYLGLDGGKSWKE